MFKEAPWVIPATEISDPKMLYVDAFHFHRAGHEGHSQYTGRFPNGISFADTEIDVIRKLGQPKNIGGGGYSNFLKKTVPRWLKYQIVDSMLHLQLDADSHVEMVTLYAPDLQQVG